jgi:predicted RNase H-like HicB family nuclease
VSTYRYELIVYWSAEDVVFVADVPELPGCMAHGATPAEAVAQAQEAIALWIETAREDGRTIPEPKGRRLLLA